MLISLLAKHIVGRRDRHRKPLELGPRLPTLTVQMPMVSKTVELFEGVVRANVLATVLVGRPRCRKRCRDK